jgi:hypothetical protein
MEATLEEAARRLGCSTEAVRKRAARGTLPSRHDGRRLVIILPDGDAPSDGRPDGDRPPDAGDRPRPDDHAGVVAAMQQTIDLLTAQLHEKDEQIRRAQEAEAEQRRIIAALMQRPIELAQAVEPVDASGSTSDRNISSPAPSSPTPAPATPLSEPPAEPVETPRRSFWARLFGR